MTEEQPMTVKQVAEYLQVHEKTVGLWLRDKSLKGIRLGSGRNGEWRIARLDLQAFLDARKQ